MTRFGPGFYSRPEPGPRPAEIADSEIKATAVIELWEQLDALTKTNEAYLGSCDSATQQILRLTPAMLSLMRYDIATRPPDHVALTTGSRLGDIRAIASVRTRAVPDRYNGTVEAVDVGDLIAKPALGMQRGTRAELLLGIVDWAARSGRPVSISPDNMRFYGFGDAEFYKRLGFSPAGESIAFHVSPRSDNVTPPTGQRFLIKLAV